MVLISSCTQLFPQFFGPRAGPPLDHGLFQPKNQGFFDFFRKIAVFSAVIWLTFAIALSNFALIVRNFSVTTCFCEGQHG
jgi:hypothetical protein